MVKKMNEEWRNELVTKGTAYDALANLDQYAEVGDCLSAIKVLPPEQPQSTMGQVADAVQSTKDCISRQAAIDALGDMVMNWTDSEYELGQLNQWKEDRKAIIDLPSAQPQRMKGKWIGVGQKQKDGYVWMKCSVCGTEDVDSPVTRTNFCPNCGADMRGGKDGTD